MCPGLLRLLLASLVAGAFAQPACVLSPTGTMLCCAADDLACIAKVQKAHTEPQKDSGEVVPAAPSKPQMVGSVYTFNNASIWDHTSSFDVALVGVPFGLEAGYEAPGMQLVRKETRSLAPYSRLYGASIKDLRIVDGQDLTVNGVSVARVKALEAAASSFFSTGRPLVAVGGDQFITFPLLRAAKAAVGDFAMLHIDKDLAIGSGSREQGLSKATALFWGAAASLFDTRHSLHVGSRGNLPSQQVELLDQELGFQTIPAEDFVDGVHHVIARVKARLARRDGTFMPAYLSLDLDVLDPVYFPAGGKEVGGLTVSQLRALLAGLRPFCRLVGADIRDLSSITDPGALRIAATLVQDVTFLAGLRPDATIANPPLQHEL